MCKFGSYIYECHSNQWGYHGIYYVDIVLSQAYRSLWGRWVMCWAHGSGRQITP